jgi:hypothetical protein
MAAELWQPALLGASLAFSILAGARGVPSLRPAPWQPASIAFAIWAPIYAGLALTVYSVAMKPQPPRFAVALAASLLCSGGWLVSVRAAWYVTSAVCISTASLLASLAVLASDGMVEPAWRAFAIAAGPGLYAGWLGCAAGLGVNIAVYDRATTTDDLPAVALLPGAGFAALCAAFARNPATGLAILWAVGLIPSIDTPTLAVRAVGGTIALVSSSAAVARLLAIYTTTR